MPFILACAACFSASDAPLAKGLNGGIYFLMAILICVLAGFLAFTFYLAKKDKLNQ